MIQKHCKACDRTIDVSFFGSNSSKKDGLQAQCKKCKKKSDARYYSQNKDIQLERNKKNKKAKRDRINSFKSDGCCVDNCDEKELCCLDFHHKDGEKKEMDISKMIVTRSMEAVLEEIKKCVVVCSNCHRKITHGIITL